MGIVSGESICEFYRNSPSISQEEMASWPKHGDATIIRLHGKVDIDERE